MIADILSTILDERNAVTFEATAKVNGIYALQSVIMKGGHNYGYASLLCKLHNPECVEVLKIEYIEEVK